MDIFAKYDEEHGDWLAYTAESPYMCVSGDTEEIARGVVAKALRWYHEREVKVREQEVLQALSEVVEMPTKKTEFVDTAPSEMSIYEEAPYMNGDHA